MDISTLSTGDIILFSGNELRSKTIEYVTNSKWSHVGIVIKNTDFLINTDKKDGIFLLESDGVELEDIDSGGKVFGVQIVDLNDVIKTYDGILAYRKLKWKATNEYIHDILKVVYNTVYHKSYDWNIIDLLDPIIYKKFWILDKILFMDHRRTNAFFCSALAAYVYTQLGLLPPKTEWSLIYPQFFSEIKALENDAELGEIVVIKDTLTKN